MTANAKNGVSGTMSYSVAGKRVIAQGTLTVNNAVEPYTDIVSGLPVVYGNNTYTVVSSSVNADAFFIKENGTITSRYALTQGGHHSAFLLLFNKLAGPHPFSYQVIANMFHFGF